MNLEGITLKLVTDYLNQELLGSKIYRIFMPTPHSLLLMVRRDRDTAGLIADLGGGSPALYLAEKLPENPETPPAFCMLLRKHLEEGRITSISQSGLDRVITLEIDMLGQSSKIITKKLVFELAGKNSNALLVQDGVIMDCLRHVGAAQSSYRQLLPGKEYVTPPPQEGMNMLTEAPAAIVKAANAVPAANFLKGFISSTVGMGKATASQLLATADIFANKVRLEPADEAALATAIEKLQEQAKAGTPVYALISRTNQVKTILSLRPLLLEEGMSIREFPNINAAINYAASLQPIQLPQHDVLQKLVASELEKLKRKEAALYKDLENAQDAEQQRMLADSIMASIYQLKKGQTEATILNIYDGQQVNIRLSPLLTPTENAQAYYKRYNKYKRAQTEVQVQLQATEEALVYMSSLEASLLTATTKNEIEEIRQELIAAGVIKLFGKKKKTALQKSQPLHIKLNEDTDLYIGKNNRQNDYVTFTVAGPRDLWFHTKDIPGSHVVLKTALAEPHEEDVQTAVQLAAYFSKARTGSNVPVDCVQRRYVKKPAGSKPGFVIFTNQTTYYATPSDEVVGKYVK